MPPGQKISLGGQHRVEEADIESSQSKTLSQITEGFVVNQHIFYKSKEAISDKSVVEDLLERSIQV